MFLTNIKESSTNPIKITENLEEDEDFKKKDIEKIHDKIPSKIPILLNKTNITLQESCSIAKENQPISMVMSLVYKMKYIMFLLCFIKETQIQEEKTFTFTSL